MQKIAIVSRFLNRKREQVLIIVNSTQKENIKIFDSFCILSMYYVASKCFLHAVGFPNSI